MKKTSMGIAMLAMTIAGGVLQGAPLAIYAQLNGANGSPVNGSPGTSRDQRARERGYAGHAGAGGNDDSDFYRNSFQGDLWEL